MLDLKKIKELFPKGTLEYLEYQEHLGDGTLAADGYLIKGKTDFDGYSSEEVEFEAYFFEENDLGVPIFSVTKYSQEAKELLQSTNEHFLFGFPLRQFIEKDGGYIFEDEYGILDKKSVEIIEKDSKSLTEELYNIEKDLPTGKRESHPKVLAYRREIGKNDDFLAYNEYLIDLLKQGKLKTTTKEDVEAQKKQNKTKKSKGQERD